MGEVIIWANPLRPNSSQKEHDSVVRLSVVPEIHVATTVLHQRSQCLNSSETTGTADSYFLKVRARAVADLLCVCGFTGRAKIVEPGRPITQARCHGREGKHCQYCCGYGGTHLEVGCRHENRGSDECLPINAC